MEKNLEHTLRNTGPKPSTGNGSADQSNLNHESLLQGAAAGDANSFARLCEQNGQRIFNIVSRITKNHEDAEDALQDSYLRAFVHLKDFDRRSSFSTWLTRIAINSALMKLRKNRTCREVSMDEPADDNTERPHLQAVDSDPDPEERYAQSERARIVRGAVCRLRPKLRRVVELAQLEERPMKEAAEMMGISVGTAKARLFHGRVALRKSRRLRSLDTSWLSTSRSRFAYGRTAPAQVAAQWS
jgi:RNA polymerase sigma factor (sigma-70 family)